MNREHAKAHLLLEALPYIRNFYGQTVVIKYGGHAMVDEQLQESFALNVILLKYIGINPVIVHGGGPQIGRMLKLLNIESQFKQGLRVTDDATMDVVEMVLVGKVNKNIVNLINLKGGSAVGLSGKDGRLITARKLEMVLERGDAPPEIIDLGKVGEVTGINTQLITTLLAQGFIPVIAPVGVDEDGETYNINADTVAGAVAAALGAKRLVLLTDVSGVLDKDKTLISSLDIKEASQAMADGVLVGGMIPKVSCCMEAVDAGVEKAHILDGRVENCIILELFTRSGIGTEIVCKRCQA
ncbi:acetylglutamate kinase [Solidesulfovibrio magneticus]|uniref:Acetylglutamate kinase n=1 Tax=Solidesulfovibrio magneticus (strain ATCC 700980 / DSM 13731 / RS-1) TaxID=573370 RepID=ARGB_SOLM1|nr:acetylglutamate kinase [Solidesulfovibrio magneticus]C4XN27.1 RecName: Full=Acetylglutamate kinase; AltName: Full=N-acetyl-L-glutamate 5-phosphotransferase; AltName: Full=NAG kinase; Short=NAGK [Solidesulfovibrio magneticus RS-1]BAH77330.1 acetylglutamate kinase [Solidesulfovibrio magneticus RS-1]